MSLKRYEAEVNGHKTTLLLSDEDAAAQGFTLERAGKTAPTNKAAEPEQTKSEEPKKGLFGRTK